MSDKADIKELAVAAWRLEKWLDNLVADRKMAAKSALRSIKKYISASGGARQYILSTTIFG